MDDEDLSLRRCALVARIEAAFADTALGDGISLHQAQAMDDRLDWPEQCAQRGLDTEGRWQDVPDAAIARCLSALSYLDTRGLRFYLPAFMRLGVRRGSPLAERARETCEFTLLNDRGKSLRQTAPAAVAARLALTGAQVAAVAEFLRYSIGVNPQNTAVANAVDAWGRLAESLASPPE